MRKIIGVYDKFIETMEQMGGSGLLLVTGKEGNPMTIGWGTIGIIWGVPMFCIHIRPSRYSHRLIEALPEFTVNVPTRDMREKVSYCGTESGWVSDKIKHCGFTMTPSEHVSVPYIAECPIHYECKVVHKNKVEETALEQEITSEYYPWGNYHTIYFGKIMNVFSRD
jgi:flavin reductase (DIM6/NTAB) family NADH-FMN oxidoreductase RutF